MGEEQLGDDRQRRALDAPKEDVPVRVMAQVLCGDPVESIHPAIETRMITIHVLDMVETMLRLGTRRWKGVMLDAPCAGKSRESS